MWELILGLSIAYILYSFDRKLDEIINKLNNDTQTMD